MLTMHVLAGNENYGRAQQLRMEQRRLPVGDKRRQQLRDDRLWKREQQRAVFYNLKRIRCPCSKCKGRVQCSLEKVKEHLILYGRLPAFRLWRGPGDRDSSDEEWESEFKTAPRAHEDGRMDVGLEVRSMVEDVFQEIDAQEPIGRNIAGHRYGRI